MRELKGDYDNMNTNYTRGENMAFLYMRTVLKHVETQDKLRWRKISISRPEQLLNLR